MYSRMNFSKVDLSGTVHLRAVIAVLFVLTVSAKSLIHSEVAQAVDGWAANAKDWLTSADSRANLSCPSPESIGNCACTAVTEELFLDCSAVLSEEELALVFQQDFPVKTFAQFDLNSNPNIKFLGAITNGFTFERIYLDFNENLEMISDEFLAGSKDTLEFLQIKFSKLHRDTFPFLLLPFLTRLQALNLDSSKQLTSIPKIVSESLTEASFQGSSISSLETGTFDGTPQLSQISLNKNNLSSLEQGSFRLTDTLSNVFLFENSIATIEPGAFILDADNGTLEYLLIDLSSNMLTELRTGTFPLPDCPTSLLLDFNTIDTVRPGAFVLPSTTNDFSLNVYLSNNQLTVLEQEVFGGVFPYLTSLIVYSNPLTCGCDLAWIVLNSDYMDKVDELATCVDGINLHALDPEDFDRFC